jgi:putative ABC transport system ATP-binding protein
MLQMTNLSKVYRTQTLETHALRDFSIHVREGEFVAVTGPSGSGKTTFLSIAGLLDEFSHGQYTLDGVPTRGLTDLARSRLRNEKIGFIFQSFNLIPDLTVRGNLEVPLHYRGVGRRERRARTDQVLERVGLSARAGHLPGELSGGQQQRVAIARALVGAPRLLLADEPTGNLDTSTARAVMLLLEELHAQGATLVMVTHDPSLAGRAQRQVHIVDGQVVDLGGAEPPLIPGVVCGDEAPR